MLRHHAEVLEKEERGNERKEAFHLQSTPSLSNEAFDERLDVSFHTQNSALNVYDSFFNTAVIQESLTEPSMRHFSGYHASNRLEINDNKRSRMIAFMENECADVRCVV
jgi:hypothetical protein